MSNRRHGRHLGRSLHIILGWATMSLAGLAPVGCQSIDGPSGDFRGQASTIRGAEGGASGIIMPQSFIYWSIQATEGLPNKLMTGQSLVGPEGMMELGPYGAVKVVGLNVDQARSAVERQLSRYLKNPQVTLSLEAPSKPVAISQVAAPNHDKVANAPQTGGGKEKDQSGPLAVTTCVPAGWQAGQIADDNSAPAQAPAIEIPAPPTLAQSFKEPELTAPPELVKPKEDKAVSSSPPRPLASSLETPADLPIKSTERVSQWKPMVRHGDTSAIPLVPTGLDNASASPTNVATKRSWGVINAVAQDKETPLQGPAPRVMPKAADSPKSEILQGPPPREVMEPQGALIPHSGVGAIGAPVPREGAKVSLPPYVIEPPDILLIESTQKIPDQPIRGQHLVRPDGTVSLGIYGSAYVAGMTLEQARESIGRTLATRIKDFDLRNLNVDILAYNSKFYYVITDGAGYGEQVIRMPITGSETVLDGISQIYGLPAVASKKRIWVARRSGDGTTDQVLPVDWCGISQRGSEATNYQIMPGDRIYVDAKKWVRFDTGLARFLSPVERVLGITLLGSETVNSISGRTSGTGGGF
jgi:polysaccharide export outer membrane protein